MSRKTVAAAEFKAKCLNLIDHMATDGEPVVVTKRGKPVALLSPIADGEADRSIIGALKGTVRNYDDPFSPVVAADAWDASR